MVAQVTRRCENEIETRFWITLRPRDKKEMPGSQVDLFILLTWTLKLLIFSVDKHCQCWFNLTINKNLRDKFFVSLRRLAASGSAVIS